MTPTPLPLALGTILLASQACPAAAALPAGGDATLRRVLARLPHDGSRDARIVLPTGERTTATFRVRDSLTVPVALTRKFPGLRSYRGEDDAGRTVRLDTSPGGIRASIRDGAREWLLRPGDLPSSAMTHAPAPVVEPPRRVDPAFAPAGLAATGGIRHEFRLAVAASSAWVQATGGTTGAALAEIAHLVNRANEVFETEVGVHFTLVATNDRIVRTSRARDPFARIEPGPASVELIDREIGRRNYDVGHALSTFYGGETMTGTSCSDDRSRDFFAGHKAAAWSGHPEPAGSPDAAAFMIHVLARQIGAWPTANGCSRATLDDRAFEPGGGSTVMGFAPSQCGGIAQQLQPHADLYLHAANIAQIHGWLGSRGGVCARKRLLPVAAPWIDPEALAEEKVIPARTPFLLDAHAASADASRRLTYTWEQMDTGAEQKAALHDEGEGPLFRSFAPTTSGQRVFPRMPAVLGHEPSAPGEALPTTSRRMTFRLTVRDNGGDEATVASADTRVRVVDTGRAFAVTSPAAATHAVAGGPLSVRWDVAGTTEAPISCQAVAIDLSVDGGTTWEDDPLARSEANDGGAEVMLPAGMASTDRARLRVRCDWRPFFAVSPGDFHIDGASMD
jgi:hypothetical protein